MNNKVSACNSKGACVHVQGDWANAIGALLFIGTALVVGSAVAKQLSK